MLQIREKDKTTRDYIELAAKTHEIMGSRKVIGGFSHGIKVKVVVHILIFILPSKHVKNGRSADCIAICLV